MSVSIILDDGKGKEITADKNLIFSHCIDGVEGNYGVVVKADNPEAIKGLVTSIIFRGMQVLAVKENLPLVEADKLLTEATKDAIAQAHYRIIEHRKDQ